MNNYGQWHDRAEAFAWIEKAIREIGQDAKASTTSVNWIIDNNTKAIVSISDHMHELEA